MQMDSLPRWVSLVPVILVLLSLPGCVLLVSQSATPPLPDIIQPHSSDLTMSQSAEIPLVLPMPDIRHTSLYHRHQLAHNIRNVIAPEWDIMKNEPDITDINITLIFSPDRRDPDVLREKERWRKQAHKMRSWARYKRLHVNESFYEHLGRDLKVAYVVGFGSGHVQALMETLMQYEEAKKKAKSGQKLPELFGVYWNLSDCLMEVVKAVSPSIKLIHSEWPKYGDIYYMKFELFSYPVFRSFDAVIWSDVDRFASPNAFYALATGASLHQNNDTLFIMTRSQLEEPNFFVNLFNETQLKIYLDRGYENYLSVQSNSFEIRPANLIPLKEMNQRLHDLLTTFPPKVVNKNDQCFLPYLVGREEITEVIMDFPRGTLHLTSGWLKDIYGDYFNFKCQASWYVRIRKHFTSQVLGALSKYRSRRGRKEATCVQDTLEVENCHREAIKLLDDCERLNQSRSDAQIAHIMHARCLQAFKYEPVPPYSEMLESVLEDIRKWRHRMETRDPDQYKAMGLPSVKVQAD